VSLIDGVARPVAAVLLAALFSTCHASCKPAVEPSGPTAGDVYKTQLLECVIHSKTKAESHACRVHVNEQWGVCASHPELCQE
jgi:hypothetical protein